VKEQVDLSEDFLARLDAALESLQNGNALAALEQFEALEKEQPDVATMSLLIANAALLGDNPDTAQERIAESIRRRESVSNALTLQAIVEAKLATDSEYKKMGSPKVRIEQLLRQAIAADSSNARPYFELATLKRFEGKLDEAEALLLSTSLRINAADSRTVTDTALALTRQQQLSDTEVRVPENPAPTPEALFSAAYAAMRLGDTARAQQLLESAKSYFPGNVFRQILKDPAFIPYSKKPAYAAYFQTPEKPRQQ
jgi:predicted Zn-dependent protease